ncbi:hypothetical protein B0H16DRAFT_1892298 [Mycena metata]|uniref:Uncharacterized protein n=1 Tax=Mycena metata TaxID=1033252 RepID=A0AAD7I6Q6_9AGAR|nr:hypothetical protein B0H16DRAFT_1892298 [Mycena metata]
MGDAIGKILHGLPAHTPLKILSLLRHLALDLIVSLSYGFRLGATRQWALEADEGLNVAIGDFPSAVFCGRIEAALGSIDMRDDLRGAPRRGGVQVLRVLARYLILKLVSFFFFLSLVCTSPSSSSLLPPPRCRPGRWCVNVARGGGEPRPGPATAMGEEGEWEWERARAAEGSMEADLVRPLASA